jgi:sarcosine oxidase, subunit alpha
MERNATKMRIDQNRTLLPEVRRGLQVQIQVDGKTIDAYQGETIAAALLSAGIRTFRLSQKHKQPRGLYCGMGVCYECQVTVNGVHGVRACLEPVEAGMEIFTSKDIEL